MSITLKSNNISSSTGTVTIDGNIAAENLSQVAFSGDYNDLTNKPPFSSGGQLVDDNVDGTQWFRKYSDGWIEQGGYVSNVPMYGSVTTSLVVPLSNTDYTIVIGSAGGSESICKVSTSSKTTSSFVISRQYTGNGRGDGPCYWCAYGQ